jgi:hypothetical protein
VRSQVAIALRLAAHSLHYANDYMGEFFRRICRKFGRPQAITATTHKLARIVFHLVSTGETYDESVFHKFEEEALKRAEMWLRRQAAHLGFRISCSLGVGFWEVIVVGVCSFMFFTTEGIPSEFPIVPDVPA